MATVISTSSLPRCGLDAAEVDIRKLFAGFPEEVWVWDHRGNSRKQPGLVLLSPRHGLYLLEVVDWRPAQVKRVSADGVTLTDGETQDVAGELGQKLEQMRSLLLGTPAEDQIEGLLLLPFVDGQSFWQVGLQQAISPDAVVTAEDLAPDAFPRVLPELSSPWSDDILAQCRSRLYPETTFEPPRRLTNSGHEQRAAVRVQLEAAQEELARSVHNECCVVQGVAGSGKTLVLAARARHLASAYPDWNIVLLCYNRSLVRQLIDMLGPWYPRVQVDTVFSWAKHHRVYLAWKDQPENLGKEERRIDDAIRSGLVKGICDAILVDEGQDFRESWFRLLRAAVRPNRGGMLVVLDGSQAIYREPPNGAFPDDAQIVRLETNYRNTEQIGRLAIESLGGMEKPSQSSGSIGIPSCPKFATQGEKVQLVWAESWDQQAESVACEIRRLIDEQIASAGDIAVLFATWKGTRNRLVEAIKRWDIPCFVLTRDRESRESFDLNDDTVKLMTVYSAKGLEFPVVFFFAIDSLRLSTSARTPDDFGKHQLKVAYVGLTRATDLLYATYTRPNSIVQRAQQLDQWCEGRAFPEDFA